MIKGWLEDLKVLHINCNYLLTRLHQNMIVHLESNGVDCTVFVPVVDDSAGVISLRDKEIVSKCIKRRDRFLFFHKQEKIFKIIEKEIDVKAFDCIHAYTLFTDGYCARRLSQKYNIPYVVAVRNTDINYFFKYRPWLKRSGLNVMKNAENVFFLSTTYRDYLLNKYLHGYYYNRLRNKCKVIPNGIDDYWFDTDRTKHKEHNIEKKKLRIAYVGEVSKNKNLLATIKALDILKKQGWEIQYNFAGKIKNQRVFKQVMRKKYCNYKGILAKEEVKGLYDVSDVFVMPSFYESFGLVYAEAMSQGLPVVYTRGQGFDQWFPDGEVGWSVDPNRPNEIVNAILKITEDYKRYKGNALRGSNRFKWTRIVVEYLEIYKGVENIV